MLIKQILTYAYFMPGKRYGIEDINNYEYVKMYFQNEGMLRMLEK